MKFIVLLALSPMGLYFLAPAFSFAQSPVIEQVPPESVPTDNEEAKIQATNHGAGQQNDYQKEILSNPIYSEPARANALIDGHIGINTAVIIQNGKANKSSITQQGQNNYARQLQQGESNELTVDQEGEQNCSEETQNGTFNRKKVIQNGESRESVTIEQVSPVPRTSP